MEDYTNNKTSLIPLIDLKQFDDLSSYKKLREACEEWGCFRIFNHGIPAELMAEMKEVVRCLFDLPAEVKRRNSDVIAGSGYMAPSKKNPLYESLGLYDLGSSEALHSFCHQLGATTHQREIIEKYAEEVNKLAIDMGKKLAKSVDLECDLFKGWPCTFRINKYHFSPESVGSSGVQIHTDSGFLTILQEDESVGGLEVMNKLGDFVAVDPWPGTLLLNVGDVAKVWSNGRFHNVKHRVQCKEASIRVSIASFLLWSKNDLVEAPHELVDDQHPRLYAPFTYGDYRKLRLSTKLEAGEALELVRAHTEE